MDNRLTSILVSTLLVGAWGMGSNSVWAASESAEAEYRAELQECKKMAEPKARDECVSNAKNRYERGKKAEKMPADKGAAAKADTEKASMKPDKGKKAK